MNVNLAEQREHTLGTFDVVEELEAVAAELDESKADRLHDVVEQLLDQMPPVRVTVAASLLGLSKPTIAKWCERGVLRPAVDATTSVQTLEPHRLHEVLHVVNELRAAAQKPGNLVEQVWHRLQDQALLETDEVRAGLAAWKAGDLQDA